MGTVFSEDLIGYFRRKGGKARIFEEFRMNNTAGKKYSRIGDIKR